MCSLCNKNEYLANFWFPNSNMPAQNGPLLQNCNTCSLHFQGPWLRISAPIVSIDTPPNPPSTGPPPSLTQLMESHRPEGEKCLLTQLKSWHREKRPIKCPSCNEALVKGDAADVIWGELPGNIIELCHSQCPKKIPKRCFSAGGVGQDLSTRQDDCFDVTAHATKTAQLTANQTQMMHPLMDCPQLIKHAWTE